LNKSVLIEKKITDFDESTAKLYKELEELPWKDSRKLIAYKTVIDNTTGDVYSIHYGGTKSIFVTKFTKDGVVSWTKVIPRMADKPRPGFVYAMKKGQFHFVCLDNPENIDAIDSNNFLSNK
jgi:hypothetical protein